MINYHIVKILQPNQQERICRKCHGKLKIARRNYLFTESGLSNVLLLKAEILVCEKCKRLSPRIPQHEDLLRTIAVALIDKPSELAGDEVCYLRKYLKQGSVSRAE